VLIASADYLPKTTDEDPPRVDPGFVKGERKGRANHGERVESEPVTGVWRQSPQRGPVVQGWRSGGANLLEAESFSSIFIQKGQKFSI